MLQIKLTPRLFDLFQHCEMYCTPACCGWAAFDFSDRSLQRFRDFREPETIAATLTEIEQLTLFLDGRKPDQQTVIEGQFKPTIGEVLLHLRRFESAFQHGAE